MVDPARIHVRFSDLDVLGHVNNNIYSSYFEIARVHYFKEVLGKEWDWKKNTVVLVKNTVEFVKPVLLYDEPFVTMNVDHIGNKSFTLSYELRVNGELYTKGSTVLVAFDGETHQSMEIHPEMKNALLSLKKEQ
jgi:acyl-CoA thioester hydrolase